MAAAGPGVFAMSITPFTEDGRIDEPLFRDHLDFMAAGGVGVFLCSQGSGEGDLLTAAEKLRIYELGVDQLKGKTPVCSAGIGLGHTTEDVVELAKGAAAAGVDAVYLLGPRPGPVPLTRNEVETYYRTVLDAVEAPIIISSNTSLAGYTLPTEMVESLCAEYPHVTGILIADNIGPTLNLVDRYSKTVDERISIRIGMTGLILTAASLGAHGLLCFEPNIAPKLCTSVWEAMQSGDSQTLMERYRLLMRLNLLCSKYGNPRSLKEAMQIVGRPSGYLRHPYLPLSASDHNDLAEGLAALDLGSVEGY